MSGTGAPLLSLRGVRKSFGGTRRRGARGGVAHLVLDGVDLDLAPHSCTVLVGASGSGKSTLLRVVDLLEDVDDGQILLDGVDVADPWVDADAVRARLALVFQQYNLFPHLRVMDNLTLAPRVVHGRPRDEAEAAAEAMLAKVGLAHKARAYPDQLSGGEQQRVAIARALVGDPEVLLLDEVTSALDPALVGEVLDLLLDLRTEGTTMLVATHEMGFARDVADEVVFLHEGRVHERGTPAQVLDDPQRAATREFLRRLHR
ncbi:amino acid ABC transporter ATP-binding protein (PAAT family) [Sediminihabitans luteus]|uniref:Amino acid ABC transporter ATP-binding protein (PAAT family) n=1 Tax=Sediminihabitans luteus TaxID=1138585 RepID=A0A2M9CQE7_9CELL|nr:amino acid ABC transporter ATP-binding protein [Sediminihabitans luteus]PJJ74117.1 amino acid ABC transporter ATP-binding protein (PAAT family) [Sediminihabitans luteus]GII97967.1 ABC transporter [Sediminihabitans luteus]